MSINWVLIIFQGLPWWLSGKEYTCNAGDVGWILGSRRSPGEGNSNPLQHSCLENPMDRGAWWVTVHGVTKVRYNSVTKPPPPIIFQTLYQSSEADFQAKSTCLSSLWKAHAMVHFCWRQSKARESPVQAVTSTSCLCVSHTPSPPQHLPSSCHILQEEKRSG